MYRSTERYRGDASEGQHIAFALFKFVVTAVCLRA
jgi:hypothetical protein